ncbi:hypothetical protein BsWGS_26105 [Bradybaena similaris]
MNLVENEISEADRNCQVNLGFLVGDDDDGVAVVRSSSQVSLHSDKPRMFPEEPDHGRTTTEEELLFRLRFAHLSPGIDWFHEISATSRAANDMGVYHHVLAALPEFPLTIRDKTTLSCKIRTRLETSSVASSNSFLHDAKRRPQKRQSGKTRLPYKWHSGTAVPFNVWENRIGQIAAYFGSHVASYFRFLRFLALLNSGIGLATFLFVSLPQIIPGDAWSNDVQSGFFGDLSFTIFFYGAYSNSSASIPGVQLSYDRPLAYLMTWSTVNVIAILVVVFSMFLNYRRIKKTDDSEEDQFSSQTFLSWDHSLTSREGSKMKSIAITTQLKEILREEKVKRHRTSRERCKLYCVRITCSIVSAGVLAGSGYLIYFVADETITPGLNIPEVVGDFLKKYQLAIIITALKIVIPPLLSLLLILEKYHPRTQVKVQIARTVVFDVASLVVFLASVYKVSTKCLHTDTANHTYCCWENEVGEQLFQVIILDLAITLILGLALTGGRTLLVKFANFKRFGYQSFSVENLILDLVYGQALVWLGLFFAPLLGLVGFLKLWILFYFNFVLARTCCVAPNKVFRASRSGTFYLFVLLVTLFVCLLPMTYAIIQLEPSTACGPFKQKSHFYEVLTERIGESPGWIQDIFDYASTPAVVIPVLIILLLVILYYRAKSTVHKMEAKELRFILQFERKVGKRNIFARAKLQQGISVISGMDL